MIRGHWALASGMWKETYETPRWLLVADRPSRPEAKGLMKGAGVYLKGGRYVVLFIRSCIHGGVLIWPIV